MFIRAVVAGEATRRRLDAGVEKPLASLLKSRE